MIRFLFLSSKFLPALLVAFLTVASAAGQEVDVYFITGQSNAGNVGEMNSYDVQGYNGYNAASFNAQTESGFTLSFGRIRDRTSGGPVTDFVEDFVESQLDATNYAVDNIAVQLNAEFGNDIGIFSYGRNGRPLADITEESWFPGTLSNPYNAELYGAFQIWSQDRLNEIEAGPDGVAGTADDQVANVKGIFWFQGETDSDDAGARAAYQTNFENLIARFRADFNDPELPIVASAIREINANDASINQSLNAVATNDDFVSVIDISNASVYTPVSTNDVHVNAQGLLRLSDDFAEQMIILQGGTVVVNPPPVPGSVVLSTAPPTTDLIASEPTGTIGSRIFTEAGNANHARGQNFSLDPAGPFEITAITIRKGEVATYANDTMTVRIFEGTEAEFITGTGHTTAANGTDYFVGTTVTPLYSETFTLDGAFAVNSYVTFNLTTPVQVNGSDFGFLMTYEQVGGADNNFQYRENSLGGRLSVTSTGHSTSSRGFHYFVQGTEASTALLGDVDLNGVVDFFDIGPFIALLSAGTFQAEADCDENGVVDFFDIAAFIAILSGP